MEYQANNNNHENQNFNNVLSFDSTGNQYQSPQQRKFIQHTTQQQNQQSPNSPLYISHNINQQTPLNNIYHMLSPIPYSRPFFNQNSAFKSPPVKNLIDSYQGIKEREPETPISGIFEERILVAGFPSHFQQLLFSSQQQQQIHQHQIQHSQNQQITFQPLPHHQQSLQVQNGPPQLFQYQKNGAANNHFNPEHANLNQGNGVQDDCQPSQQGEENPNIINNNNYNSNINNTVNNNKLFNYNQYKSSERQQQYQQINEKNDSRKSSKHKDQDSSSSGEEIEQNCQTNNSYSPMPKTRTCNCKKTKCLKLYCDCFAIGEQCGPECNCYECCNTHQYKDFRYEAITQIREKNQEAFSSKILEDKKGKQLHKKGCNCRRSNCLKKYCECYQAGVKCGDFCKCDDCKNVDKHHHSHHHNNNNNNNSNFHPKKKIFVTATKAVPAIANSNLLLQETIKKKNNEQQQQQSQQYFDQIKLQQQHQLQQLQQQQIQDQQFEFDNLLKTPYSRRQQIKESLISEEKSYVDLTIRKKNLIKMQKEGSYKNKKSNQIEDSSEKMNNLPSQISTGNNIVKIYTQNIIPSISSEEELLQQQ